jgi:small-conductance mechanosensitive channel
LKANLRAREFVDQCLLRHEYLKRIVQRYRDEGIEIPHPPRPLPPPPAAPADRATS